MREETLLGEKRGVQGGGCSTKLLIFALDQPCAECLKFSTEGVPDRKHSGSCCECVGMVWPPAPDKCWLCVRSASVSQSSERTDCLAAPRGGPSEDRMPVAGPEAEVLGQWVRR